MSDLALPDKSSQSEVFLGNHSNFYKHLLDELYDAVYFVDLDRRILYWNRAAEALTGYSASDVVGKRCSDDILCHVDESGHSLCLDECPLSRSMRDGSRREADVYLKHRNGHRVPVSVRSVPILDEKNRVLGAVEVFVNITRRKHLERKNLELGKLAYIDTLTHLVNRRFLNMRIQQSIEELKQFGRSFGVFLVDVDKFKLINDAHGHTAGDSVLEHLARTISSSLRAGDTVGRWGGEEFLAILADADQDTTSSVGERCRMLVRNSTVPIDGRLVRATVSIGATLLRESDTPESCFRRVDLALYHSKREGRDRVTFIAE